MSPQAPRTEAYDRALGTLGLSDPARLALSLYLARLDAWSARVNLTGARTPEGRVALLVRPVLPWAPRARGPHLVDVGSGNGSPGLVLALVRPDLRATLLEPRLKRWAFLRDAARAAGRADVRVLRERHDTYGGPRGDTVTVRALALPLPALAPLVAPGGELWVFGPAPRGESALLEAGGVESRDGFDVHRFARRSVPRET